MNNWKEQIAIAWLVKQACMELDKKNIFSYHLPNLAATEESIVLAEKKLGCRLDEKYRAFLQHADGWPCFWHNVDLFGTNDLIEGVKKETGEFALSMLDEEVLTKSGVKRHELLPIAATPVDKDLFVITKPSCRTPGSVLWFAGEEVERFKSFDDFFIAMTEYSRGDIQWFQKQAKQEP
jgi:hypothetical protein